MNIRHTARSLNSIRRTLACVVLTSAYAIAQSAAPQAAASSSSATPTFDVATIKQQDPKQRNWFGVRDMPDGLNASAASLVWLVQRAYGLPTAMQVAGGPDWAHTEPYDIQAKMSGADVALLNALPQAEQKTRRQLMLQALLADRFKLKTHAETRQLPVYDLVTMKDISKLKDVGTDPNKISNSDGTPTGSIRFGKDSASLKGISMPTFVGFLWQQTSDVGRPVIDKTGLTSTYDFTLNWSLMRRMAGVTPSTGDPADGATSIFTALKEVGLKLQPSTGPIATIVIDHAERPTAD